MKKSTTIFLIMLCCNCFAANHYFSSTGSDANNGLSSLLPQLSISKLNTDMATYANGDSVLFKCGDTFYGAITGFKTGLKFGSYGTGAKPIISGFTNVTSWTNLGSNIWESVAITGTNKPNMVTIGGVAKAMGRYPNAGYNFYTSFTTGYIKDAALTGRNFTGGRLCVRKLHDIISNDSITAHSIDTLYANSISGYNTLTGYGYFVENHPNTLDTEGEWYFNPITKKLRIYSTSNPTSVKISTIDTLCYLSAFDNIAISGIEFQGANIAAVAFGGPTVGQAVNDTIRGCSFTYSGRNAIYCTFNRYCSIEGNSIYYSLNNGIYCENEGGRSLNINISNNTIKHTGTLPGMGFIQASTSSNISYNGITVLGDSAVITGNIIDTVGHVGIAAYYSNTKVRNNNINYHNYITDDGGGINFFDVTFGATTETGIDIVGNTVTRGIGAGVGTPDGGNVANGIYLDDKINGVRIDSNIVTTAANHGIYYHNITNVTASRNNVSNCGVSGFAIAHDDHAYGIPISNLIFTNNIITQPTGWTLYFYNFIDGGNLDSMFTRLDSNTYYRSSLTDTAFRTIRFNGTSYFNQHLNFGGWRAGYPLWDVNSTLTIPADRVVIKNFKGYMIFRKN
jgi:hypothetical protein